MWDFDFRPRCAAGACGLISFLLPFNLRAYLRGLKSHDHETWHVGPLNDEELHGPANIAVPGRYRFLYDVNVALLPQGRRYSAFTKPTISPEQKH